MCTLCQLPQTGLYPRLDYSLTARAAHEGCWEALLQHTAFPPWQEEKDGVGGLGAMAIDPFITAEQN